MRIAVDSVAAACAAVVNVVVAVEIAYLFNRRSLTVMNTLLQSAPISAETWLMIAGVALATLLLVNLEKWLRFGRGRGEHAMPE